MKYKIVVEPIEKLEIHLTTNKGRCNLHCPNCQGRKLSNNSLDLAEPFIRLIQSFTKDSWPRQVVISGIYTEPTTNPEWFEVMKAVKKSGRIVGLHTNGTLLWKYQSSRKTLLECCSILSGQKGDYISISIDAANDKTWAKTKGINSSFGFSEILKALDFFEKYTVENPNADFFKLRLTYLLNEYNSTHAELLKIIDMTKKRWGNAIASLRISTPYDFFGSKLGEVANYHKTHERLLYKKALAILKPLLSYSMYERPYTYLLDPDIRALSFLLDEKRRCVVPFTGLTIGTDGNYYPCCTVANQRFSELSLGIFTDKQEDLLAAIKKAQQSSMANLGQICALIDGVCSRSDAQMNNRV